MSDTYSHGDPNYLSDSQLAQLLKAIRAERVSRDPKGMSYVEAYEIRAHLTRIFGFGRWDEVITQQRVVFEDRNDADEKKPRWTTCWYAHCTLTIRTPSGATLCVYGEGATGDAQNQPSRADAADLACKTAASQALKRCAYNLGDQFGLGLFDKGSLRPLVRGALWPTLETDVPPAAGGEVDAHVSSLAPENAAANGESQQREVSSPAASKAPTSAPAAAGGGVPVPDPAPAVEFEDNGPIPQMAETHAAAMETLIADERFYDKVMDAATVPVEDGFRLHPGGGFLDAAPTAGPTVPDVATPSPAVSEEPASDPEPEDPTAAPAGAQTSTPAATSAPVEPSPEPSASTDPAPASPEAEDSGDEDPIDAWERIVATLAVIRMSSPEEGLKILGEMMELAVVHKLGSRRYADTGKGLAVVLTEHMRDARAAIERRRAAVTI